MLDGKDEIIPLMVEWAAKKNKKVLEKWEDFSLEQVVVRNNIESLDKLFAQGIRPKKSRATELLYQVVYNNKDEKFVPGNRNVIHHQC